MPPNRPQLKIAKHSARQAGEPIHCGSQHSAGTAQDAVETMQSEATPTTGTLSAQNVRGYTRN